MLEGNIVTFKNEPTENTPGRPDSHYACTGVIVTENIEWRHAFSHSFNGRKWCEILWSSNQVTRCYKDDLKVVKV
jgi:hypothetical protein